MFGQALPTLFVPKAEFQNSLCEAAQANGLKFKDEAKLSEWREETYNVVNSMMKRVKKEVNRQKPVAWVKQLGLAGADGEDDEDGEEGGEEEQREGDEVESDEEPLVTANEEQKQASAKSASAKVEGAPKGSASSATKEPTKAVVEYVYSWDEEKTLAIRRPKGSRKTVPWEHCACIEMPSKHPKPTDSMVARWPDGTSSDIAQYTYAKFKGEQPAPRPKAKCKATGKAKRMAKGKASAAKKQYKHEFKKEMADGAVLLVLLRDNNYRGKPKQRLCCMRDGAGQVCQLDVKHFYQKEFKDKSEEEQLYQAEEKALEYMCALAERYFKNELTREQTIDVKKTFLDDVKAATTAAKQPDDRQTSTTAAPEVESEAAQKEPEPAKPSTPPTVLAPAGGTAATSTGTPSAAPTATRTDATTPPSSTRPESAAGGSAAPAPCTPKRACQSQPEERVKRVRSTPPVFSDDE